MTNNNAVISIADVRFGYELGQAVVQGCNALLLPGRITALVGPNAAGKTTLMRLMLGLLKPWSGSVHMNGAPIEYMDARARARVVSYVPQRPGVRFAFTVKQVIAMGTHALSDRQASLHAVQTVLSEAGLDALSGRTFSKLSGGQQQRVLLARAEVQASQGGRGLLLDEPGSHLDLHHRHQMMQRLRTLAEDGLAVLVVLHDLDLACRYADDAWLMDKGKLVATGGWQDVLTPERLAPVYRIGLRRIEDAGERPLLAVAPDRDATMP